LAEWYDYRIVNVNVNVMVAGLAALGFTVVVMQFFESIGLLSAMAGWAGAHHVHVLGYEFHVEKALISTLTFLVDLVADVAVYYVLHWIANHMPRSRPRPRNHAYADLSFMRDATLVQFQRALLSPLLYVIALGLQNKLLHDGMSLAKATTIGFVVGLVITRIIHTFWMLRVERSAGRHSAADIVGPDRHHHRSDNAA
jgi:hypothetical protein